MYKQAKKQAHLNSTNNHKQANISMQNQTSNKLEEMTNNFIQIQQQNEVSANKDVELGAADLKRDNTNNLNSPIIKSNPIIEDDKNAFNDSGNVTEGSDRSIALEPENEVNSSQNVDHKDHENSSNSKALETNPLGYSLQTRSLYLS